MIQKQEAAKRGLEVFESEFNYDSWLVILAVLAEC
jgi:hypothetical protein